MDKTYEEIQDSANQFTGTEHYHRLAPFAVMMTDGAAWFFREVAGWLVTDIAANGQNHKEPFQVWTLVVLEDKGQLTMREDTYGPPLVRKYYDYADLPDGTYKFYLCQGERPVLMLPSEY